MAAHTDFDFTNVSKFNSQEWIGMGKTYSETETPLEVETQKKKLLEIPTSFQKLLPDPTIPIIQFISLAFPLASTEIVTLKASECFPSHAPIENADLSRLIQTRPIPTLETIQALEGALGQAWLDGAVSFNDWRFNDGMDHLPFWVLMFWRRLIDIVKVQERWQRSTKWLTNEMEKAKREGRSCCTLNSAYQALEHLGWNIRLRHLNGCAHSPLLATFLSTSWLSDDHIDMMMEVISERVANNPTIAKEVLIAPLSFSNDVMSIARGYKSVSHILERYAAKIREGTLRWLYFPVHVNSNHWIAFVINFVENYIAYGECVIIRNIGWNLTMHM
jgi:hypothetical protein